jgi:hypothetical protein
MWAIRVDGPRLHQRNKTATTKTSNKQNLFAAALVGVLVVTSTFAADPPKMKMTTDIPPSITTPDSVKTRLGTLSTEKAIQGNFLPAGGQAIYTDRPTITYTPLTGQKFLRGLVTPIEPKNIFFMLQSGYAADFILGLTVESLNGVHNRSATAGTVREADPEFVRALQLMREVQVAGAVGMRVVENKDKTETAVMFFRRDNLPPDLSDELAEIRRLLKLPEGQQQFNLIYSPVLGATNELAVGSRSMVQIMAAMASYANVPELDLKEGRATPSVQATNSAGNRDPVEIKCSKEKPADAFAAVPYRNHWFWVDDRDWRTKRAFTAIMFLFTMAETGADEKLPLITIPAQ